MKSLDWYIFQLQGMHFNSMGDFRWNVKGFRAKLEQILKETYEAGLEAGKLAGAKEARYKLLGVKELP